MIETKEQYEHALNCAVAGDSTQATHIEETIEALREVARAGRSLDMLLGALGAHASLAESGPDADLLHDALNALPDWILE